MKKRFIYKSICLLATAFLVTSISFAGDTGDEKDKLPPDFRSKFRASQERIVTGYHIEQFGFIGGFFSRMVKDYTVVPCCDFTGNPIDGCSGVKNCSRK